MAGKLYNLARMTTPTTGTGTLTLGSSVSGFLSFVAAGVLDGETVTYAIQDGSASEIGRGVYTASGTTLTRSVLKSTNSNSAISLSGSAQVFITPSAEDFLIATNAQTGTTYTVLQSDLGKLVTFSNAAAVAVTLPQAVTNFATGWFTTLSNVGSSAVTITPTTSTIGGASSLALVPGASVQVVSDGTNWNVVRGSGGREVLTAARTYYVRTDGSDSNTGLADTAAGAFLTIQAAINAVALLDFNAKVVTIQVRTGTYAAITLKANTGQALVSDFIIQGDTTTPSNVVISSSGVCVTATGSGVLAQFKGIKITSSGSYGFNCTAGATIQYETMDFGTCGFDHILCQTGAHITASGNYSITAGAGRHLNTIAGGIIRVLSRTLTITGTPAFSTAFAEASELGIMRLVSNTYSGSATGPRYSVTGNSVIQTFGAGATALPGNSAGSTATGGQYL